MSDITIWHNPRCSKSRETLKLIEEQGVSPEIVLYLEKTPSKKAIKEAISMLGDVSLLIRKKEALYKELGLKEKNPSQAEWVQILHDNPKLIERPLVIRGQQAILGRPPENVRQLLDQ